MLLLLLSAAWGAPVDAYATAVRLIDRLYFDRDQVDEVALLRSAARSAETDVHWLRVSASGRRVWLRHGDGRPLGEVEVRAMADLPRALRELARLIALEDPELDAEMSLLWGLTDPLDRFSRILADDRLDRFNRRLTGTEVGVGITLAERGEQLIIDEVHGEGPAAAAGLTPGAVVTHIGDQPASSLPLAEAQQRLRGPDGSQLVLRVDGEAVSLVRAEVVVPNVTHRVLEGGVGYVHIDHISQRTVENFRLAIRALRSEGGLGHGLVLDLRQNTGGSMREAARIADQFLDAGLLLRTSGPGGGPVQNLEREMRAIPSRLDLDVPVVVVVDERTASGSEIIAGILLAHDRTALVGTRTYGKGTVQKSLPISAGVHLKLTVAEYVLPHERRIGPGGLTPDVWVDPVTLDGTGAHFPGWKGGLEAPAGAVQLPHVIERPGWRGRHHEADVPLELARRALLTTHSAQRPDLVAALDQHATLLRSAEEERLVEAMRTRGTDWSTTPSPPPGLDDLVASVHATPLDARRYRLRAAVSNTGAHPAARVRVTVSCPSAPWWHGLVIPVGRVRAGGAGSGELEVELPPGVHARLDEADLMVTAEGVPYRQAGRSRLVSRTPDGPTLRVEARLAPRPGARGPHGHAVKEAQLRIHNLSPQPLAGLEVALDEPRGDGVALLERRSRLAVLSARGAGDVALAMELTPSVPLVAPLDLVLSTAAFPQPATWHLPLPTTGDRIVLEAPRIRVRTPGLTAPAGEVALPVTVTDDRRLDHVVIWVNGEKVAWTGAHPGRAFLRPEVRLLPGDNPILVQAVDDQGLAAELQLSLWGDPAAPGEGTVDAAETPPNR